MRGARILIIDDEEGIRTTFCAFLAKEGYAPIAVPDYQKAIEALDGEPFDLVFADIMLGSYSGVEILKEIKARGCQCPVVMITGAPEIETAAASLRLGAFDYLAKPIRKELLVRVTKHALQHKALGDEKRIIEAEKERYRFHLEAIFRSVEDAIVTVDDNERIIQVNEASERICGLQMNEAAGEQCDSLRLFCDRKCLRVVKQALKTGQVVREYRIECRHPHRTNQEVVVNVSPLRDSTGRQIGAVMIIRDITRLSLLERELQERNQFHGIIGRNRRMQEIYDLLENLKDIDTTVLITGSSGTGKELVARAIHFGGARAAQPFVVVNCSALAENLLESELFGHVKGAFTGAIKDKTGRFQTADRGTIFLDEIGDISPRIQLKLLRFLETKEFERVGDSTPVKLDVQVITATNRDLKAQVAKGEFREDLYYRLKVVEIKLPPLAARRDDIPLLVSHYVGVFNQRFGRQISGISPEVEKLFMEYRWPGNIRELIHTLEHAFVVCKRPLIELADLPPEIREHAMPADDHGKDAVLEKGRVMDALRQAGGNKAKAARILGISRQTIYRKLRDYKNDNPSR
ncbi:MAG TPA: sigma 54-interacting transcriptional regulator [Deltaproteobacteria bacterium]|nr:sigma 54-interacting transcriptional regulator [Deltaproteobacteria bacterium]